MPLRFAPFAFLFILFAGNIQAQPSLEWVSIVSGPNDQLPASIAVDQDNNVYTTGFYFESTDFDPGPGDEFLYGLGGDIFIQKLDADGNLVWAYDFGDFTWSAGQSIEIDQMGNVLVTGWFSGTVDFDPGPGTVELTSSGGRDIFVLKLDSDGNFLWAHGLGSSGYDTGRSIDVDDLGNIYVTGVYEDTVDFDPGTTSEYYGSAGGKDIFVLKLDPLGNFVWARSIGAAGNDSSESLTVGPGGKVVITGSFQGTVDFDPGPSIFTAMAVDGKDAFVLKLDEDGFYNWAAALGGGLTEEGKGVEIAPGGDVYVSGYFEEDCDFDPGPGTYTLTSEGSFDTFLTKLDGTGNMLWTKTIAGSSLEQAYSLYMDTDENLYINGHFYGTVDFDPGAGTAEMTSNGSGDGFLVKLNSLGEYIWSIHTGGTGEEYNSEVVVDYSGKIKVTGNFEEEVDFDPSADGSVTHTSVGYVDMYVMSLCPTTYSTLDTSVCETFVSPGGEELTTSGTYHDTIPNFIGCDSVITINLTVFPPSDVDAGPDILTCEGESIVLSASGADIYVWSDGVINGEPFVPPSGTTEYTLVGTTSDGCIGVDTLLIIVDPDMADAGEDIEICAGRTVGVSASGGVAYVWNGPGLSDESGQSIEIFADTSAYYTVDVTTEAGCVYKDSLLFSISNSPDCGISVYNAFSPDGDGVNDYFHIIGIENFPDNNVSILNRWGDVVFTQSGYDNETAVFEGKNNAGRDLKAGTYFYVCELKQGTSESGWIQIIR